MKIELFSSTFDINLPETELICLFKISFGTTAADDNSLMDRVTTRILEKVNDYN